MKIAASSPPRLALLAATAALLLATAFALFVAGSSPSARAAVNDNQTNCKGHIEKGAANADDPTITNVKYLFACSNSLTGYSLFIDGHPVQGFETEVFGSDPATKAVVPADAFSCNGDIPGFGVNCVGTYTAGWHVISGEFGIEGALCTEPRVDPILTVTNATVNAKGAGVSAIAGPYDLGRPRGCPKSKFGGKTKIPVVKDEPVLQ